MTDQKVIGKKSKAYGYNYTSLGDIALEGLEIPKMRIKRLEGDDYIEYLDGEEWQLGARIITPEMKGANEAQRYGSGLTYARRYTTLMALQLACDDDKKIEEASFDLQKALKDIKSAKTLERLTDIYSRTPEKYKKDVIPELTLRKKELGES